MRKGRGKEEIKDAEGQEIEETRKSGRGQDEER
jgi:hypothetical protein